MKKLIVLTTLLLVAGSLFAQNFEGEDVKERELKISSVKKNVFRVHSETFFLFKGDSDKSSWASGSWDYALNGVGLSYSRLIGSKVGITVVLGGLALGVEDPFSEDFSIQSIDWKTGSYPFDIGRTGFFYKLGPYFRLGRVSITPMLESVFVFNGDPGEGFSWNSTDQLTGISCGVEILITDSFIFYIEGGVLSGYRLDANLLWQSMVNSSGEDSSYFSDLYSSENFNLLACSLTLGVGLAF